MTWRRGQGDVLPLGTPHSDHRVCLRQEGMYHFWPRLCLSFFPLWNKINLWRPKREEELANLAGKKKWLFKCSSSERVKEWGDSAIKKYNRITDMTENNRDMAIRKSQLLYKTFFPWFWRGVYRKETICFPSS